MSDKEKVEILFRLLDAMACIKEKNIAEMPNSVFHEVIEEMIALTLGGHYSD